MLTRQTIEKPIASLSTLLPKLKEGELECIEYGNPISAFYNRPHIRFINTAGGLQFQVKLLSRG